jgi:uncharacterized protein YkwD
MMDLRKKLQLLTAALALALASLLCLNVKERPLVAEAASVTSATYGTPHYVRLVPSIQEIRESENTWINVDCLAYDDTGNYYLVTSSCSFWTDDPSIATVTNDGGVHTIAAGSTNLHLQFNNLTATLPITVKKNETVVPATTPSQSSVPLSTLDVYAGVDMTRLTSHRTASLNLVNSIRTAVGVTPLTLNESLNKAAQAHANYQEIDKQMGHFEVAGKPGFSGVDIGSRLSAFGYNYSAYGETVAPTTASPAGAAQTLIDAPFHRFILLMPPFREAGIGVTNGYTVIDSAAGKGINTSSDGTLVYYPYNGQSNVPTSWWAYETPNPLQYYGKAGTKVGYPITVSGSFGDKLVFNSAQISGPAGNVDYYLVDGPKSGSDYGIMLIPKEPLKNNTTYTVTINFTQSNAFNTSTGAASKSNTWSFTTESDTLQGISLGGWSSSIVPGQSVKVPTVTANYSSGAKLDVTSSAKFSSDSANVSIRDGQITGVSAGSATITVSYGDKTSTFKITVTDKAADWSETPATNGSTATGETFKDIGSHWARNTILWAQNFQVIDGYPDGTFRPDEPVTEAEFLAMVFRMYPDSVKNFSSTGPEKQWSDKYYDFAEYYQLGLESSKADPSLRNAVLLRAKVAQIIAKLSGKKDLSDEQAIQFLLDAKYSEGKTAATVAGYAGQDPLTRAEALQFLKNLKDKKFDIPAAQAPEPVKNDNQSEMKTTGLPQRKSNVDSHHNITATFQDDASVTVEGTIPDYEGNTVPIDIYGPNPPDSMFTGPLIKTYLVPVDADGHFQLKTEPLIVNAVNIYVKIKDNVSLYYGVSSNRK